MCLKCFYIMRYDLSERTLYAATMAESVNMSCQVVLARFVLRSYASYYHSSRTHRSLDNDCPDPRPVEPPEMGDVVALAQVGGLITATPAGSLPDPSPSDEVFATHSIRLTANLPAVVVSRPRR